MWLSLLFTILALPGMLIGWSVRSLAINRAKAKQAGFPILERWTTPTNPLWMMLGSSIVRASRSLNIGTEHFWRFSRFGWEANERHRVHQEIGSVFMLVTPGGNWLCVNDADVIHDILRRRTEFRRNLKQMAILAVFGDNVATTDDEEWQKHRKITAITFTEKNNELVWKQSIAQAMGMLQDWVKYQPVRTIAEDSKVFTLNVLAAALFDKVYPFQGQSQTQSTEANDDSYQYRDSLGKILAYIVPIFVLGANGMQSWWAPDSWKQAGKAIDNFRSYVTRLINEERGGLSQGSRTKQHLVAALVRACEQEARASESQTAPGKAMILSEEEIISNLFVYAFAGNDTTAITLTHIIVDLAAHPVSQDWIAEEINHYLKNEDVTEWSYDVFPKMKRCLAVVMESLRFNHPLGQLPRTTTHVPTALEWKSRVYTVPPDTSVHCSLSGLHTSPQYWGDDPLRWNPNRFISFPENVEATLENEVLAQDTSPHFLPWSDGRFLCPGKKFAQVELVAAMAVLFRRHRVQPKTRKNESLQSARQRIFKASQDIEHEGRILHEMRDPGSTCLEWLQK